MRSQANRIISQTIRSKKLRRLPRDWKIAYNDAIAPRTGTKYRALYDLVPSVAQTIASVHQVGAAVFQHEFVDTSGLLNGIESAVDRELRARVPKGYRLLKGQENGRVTMYVSRAPSGQHMRGLPKTPPKEFLEPVLASPIYSQVETAIGEVLGCLGCLPCDMPSFPAFSPSPEGIRGCLPSAAYEATVQEMGTSFGTRGSERRYHFEPKPINPAAFNRLVADLEKGL